MRPQLHLISTGYQSAEQLIEIMDRIHPEIDFIHLREKSWKDVEIYDAAKQLIETGVPKEKIMINTASHIANELGVKGVQLPSYQNDIAKVKEMYPGLTIGCSVHSVEEAIAKEREGANFVLYGHVFPSNSKRGKSPKGIAALQAVIAHVSIPVIAIGGIKPDTTKVVLQTGVEGIAVLSGILSATDVEQAVRQYKQEME